LGFPPGPNRIRRLPVVVRGASYGCGPVWSGSYNSRASSTAGPAFLLCGLASPKNLQNQAGPRSMIDTPDAFPGSLLNGVSAPSTTADLCNCVPSRSSQSIQQTAGEEQTRRIQLFGRGLREPCKFAAQCFSNQASVSPCIALQSDDLTGENQGMTAPAISGSGKRSIELVVSRGPIAPQLFNRTT